MSTVPGQWVDKWMSTPRFDVYVAAAGGDRSLGLELYEWNANMSAAVLHDLGHLEVGIRNAYDAALVDNQVGTRHWTADPLPYFPKVMAKARNGVRFDRNESTRAKIVNARKEAGGRRAPAGKVVAELMFGFWRFMTASAAEHTMWTPFLRTAFPNGTRRADVDVPMGQLHDLRNRVAHHEHLLTSDLEALRLDLLRLVQLLSDDLRDHIEVRSAWDTVAAQRPFSTVHERGKSERPPT